MQPILTIEILRQRGYEGSELGFLVEAAWEAQREGFITTLEEALEWLHFYEIGEP